MSQPNDPIPDEIQCAVETCADNIDKALEKDSPNFLAIHFICGKQEKSGLIRKSAIRLSNQFLGRVSAQSPQPDSRKHSEVLLNHVRLFDRKNTLLTLAMGKQTNEQTNRSLAEDRRPKT